MRALVLFASSEGQTAKIGEHISKRLRENGIPNDTYNVVEHSADEIAICRYDAVLIGSPLRFAEFDPRIRSCIQQNVKALKKLPSAFFSVSLGIRSTHKVDRTEVVKLTDDFLKALDFNPDARGNFAGALQYSKYGWLKKRMMRWIANNSGGENDKDYSTDHEYTDWTAVDEFATHFADGLNSTAGNTGERTPTMNEQVTCVRTDVSVFVGK